MCCLWGKQQDLNQKAEFMLVGWQFLTLRFYRVYLITCFKAVWHEGWSPDNRGFFFSPYKSHNIKLCISEKIYQKHLCLPLKHSSFFMYDFLIIIELRDESHRQAWVHVKKKKKKLGVISTFPPTKQPSGLQENTLYCDLRWGEGNFPSLKCYFFPLETSYD